MARLKNKVALVTGGARGIGQAIAELFAAEGARVVVTDILKKEGQAVADGIGKTAEFMELDVSQEADWKRVCDYVADHYKGLDIMVNNAGITGFLEASGPFDPENLDMDSWHQVLQTNLDGVALGCKYAIQLMKISGAGSIVNISSRSGIVGIPAAAAYAASKAGVRNHTKSVALYCAEQAYPIRCNSIHPGAILTPMWDAMLGEGEQRKAALAEVTSEVPLGTMGEPKDVAYAALYLASDESKYVTGTELHIDGGILAGSIAAPQQR
ncbi:glucose 1-dehydrogenase [Marinicella sp. W31]|uniref:glucose 1-dehydrogenase n=1 Tax=Marinicella sp. W31 TaxID=3023713 RepID=UPI0037568EBB